MSIVRSRTRYSAVENLTNATYRYHGSGIDGPGLGASLTLDATY